MNYIIACANTQVTERAGSRPAQPRAAYTRGHVRDVEPAASRIDEIVAARERIAGRVHRTPLLSSATAAAWTTVATGARLRDDRLFLKAEHLQKTGSFKPRGMTNKIATLPDEAKARGVITLSAGNAGQAYAWAGRVGRCRGHGGHAGRRRPLEGRGVPRLRRPGRPPRRRTSARPSPRWSALRDAEGLEFVHPFDDPAVIAGHGSIGLELLEDLPDLDVVVVGVGGGGLISGVAAALKERGPASGSMASSRSCRTRCRSRSNGTRSCASSPRASPTASGRRSRAPGRWRCAGATSTTSSCSTTRRSWPGCASRVERLKQVLEPAGAAALAAVLAGRIPIRDGERVAVVLSGGNVEVGRLGALLDAAGTLPGAEA